jgi:hypothetical protein
VPRGRIFGVCAAVIRQAVEIARPRLSQKSNYGKSGQRELIRARTTEGRERARARGVHLGRKKKLTAHQQAEAIRRRDELGEPLGDIARTFNVSRSTISRLAA